ncbi:hypothetical protein M0811_14742 [Anaeramoeba ignava]|uniref:Cyclin-like domain-containing protein n=1 Tax=Anaeramoeba ignava TaxID=1746090 RepID=A0A9Q0RG07_ANAIG|nr:hypothetical protein M0811_14742 [Anaeramoeba ignava]
MENHIILSTEKLLNTPSNKDGVSDEDERKIRVYGAILIRKIGLILKLPHYTIATAQTIFQRFYYTKSIKRIEVKVISMASVFLASKIDETPRRIVHIINSFIHVQQLEENQQIHPIDPYSQEYTDISSEIVKGESYMLHQFGFVIQVEHPFKFLLNYCNSLECSQELTQTAWNILNDSYLTTICVQFPPEVIASSCIYFASRLIDEEIVRNVEWYKLFGTTMDEILDVSLELMLLYLQNIESPKYIQFSDEK